MDNFCFSHCDAEPQIPNFGLKTLAQKDVFCLEVAVNEGLFLQFQQSIADLLYELPGEKWMEGC